MLIVRSGIFTAASATVTGLSRSSDLTPGLFLYGAEIPVNTSIQSLPAGDASLIMTNQAIGGAGTTPESIEITNAQPGVYLERKYALTDAKFVIDERGDVVEIFLRKEADVARDSYNSIASRNTTSAFHVFMRAFPVQTNPSDKQLEKAGIRERADVIVYTAMQDWINAGKGFNDIDMSGRLTVIMQGETYELKTKGLVGQMNDTFLYLTMGLFRK